MLKQINLDLQKIVAEVAVEMTAQLISPSSIPGNTFTEQGDVMDERACKLINEQLKDWSPEKIKEGLVTLLNYEASYLSVEAMTLAVKQKEEKKPAAEPEDHSRWN